MAKDKDKRPEDTLYLGSEFVDRLNTIASEQGFGSVKELLKDALKKQAFIYDNKAIGNQIMIGKGDQLVDVSSLL